MKKMTFSTLDFRIVHFRTVGLYRFFLLQQASVNGPLVESLAAQGKEGNQKL